MDRAIVDIDTGEQIDMLYPGDRIIRKNVIDKLKDAPVNTEKMYFTNGEWSKVYDEACKKISKLELSQLEFRLIFLFIPMIRYGSGLIAHDNYKPVNFKWLEHELNVSTKTIKRAMKRLLDFRIISENYSGKECVYFFNPYIYQKGRYINKTLYEMFKKSEWAKT